MPLESGERDKIREEVPLAWQNVRSRTANSSPVMQTTVFGNILQYSRISLWFVSRNIIMASSLTQVP